MVYNVDTIPTVSECFSCQSDGTWYSARLFLCFLSGGFKKPCTSVCYWRSCEEKNKSYCLWGQWEDSSICFWITLSNKTYETRQTRLGSLGIVNIEKMKVFLVENINWTRPCLTTWEKIGWGGIHTFKGFQLIL